MIRTIWWFIYFWCYVFSTIPTLIKVKKLDQAHRYTEKDAIVDREAKKWARKLIQLTGSTVTVTGEEHIPKEGAVLFVCNHQGNFDIPILLGYIDKPKAFISKIEVKRFPIIGAWMQMMNCVFMDRKDLRQQLQAINQGAEHLKHGYSLVIFPEGTRSKKDKMNKFKPGSLKLATKTGVPIVPITIKGSYKIMEANLFGFLVQPAQIEVIVSPPIYIQEAEKVDVKQLASQLEETIAKQL